jgi:hypothetical protein
MARLLEIEKVKTQFNNFAGVVKIVDDISSHSMKVKFPPFLEKKVAAKPLSA